MNVITRSMKNVFSGTGLNMLWRTQYNTCRCTGNQAGIFQTFSIQVTQTATAILPPLDPLNLDSPRLHPDHLVGFQHVWRP